LLTIPSLIKNIKNRRQKCDIVCSFDFLHKKDLYSYLKNKTKINNFYAFNLFYLKFLRGNYKFEFRGINEKSWDKYFSGEDPESLIKVDKNYP